MSAPPGLSREEKKAELIRRADSLRANCGEIWAAADERVAEAEGRLARRVFVRPEVPELLSLGLFVVQSRLGYRNRWLEPLFRLAQELLAAGRERMGNDPERARERGPVSGD